MKKIKIKASIISKDQKLKENIIGSLESDIISYEDTDNTWTYLDINRNELIRENEEMILKYLFKEKEKTIGTIFIKDLNKELEIEIMTNIIKKSNQKYYVSYIIDQDEFVYELDYEEVDHELY